MRSCVALAAFIVGALLHLFLTEDFRNARSVPDPLLDRASFGTPIGIAKASVGKQPSRARLVRTTSGGKDFFVERQRFSHDWAIPAARAARGYERQTVASSVAGTAHRPRAPPPA
ncbi:MAG: hypothetical protein KF889_18555 [Alphaproteobacteria bacterium]|nr:hypothetical protein [Alphaproteobacteria bacterium]MCW5743930.1 hypothetical protein [Alphaproteobacteria bacterium]